MFEGEKKRDKRRRSNKKHRNRKIERYQETGNVLNWLILHKKMSFLEISI